MKKRVVVADTGPLISLSLINKLGLLSDLFSEVRIVHEVWIEVLANKHSLPFEIIESFVIGKIRHTQGVENLGIEFGLGEIHSIKLYKDLKAEVLLIDDKRARILAESMGLRCMGTLGLLIEAKDVGLIRELRPLFQTFLNTRRFYSKKLLNSILEKIGENLI